MTTVTSFSPLLRTPPHWRRNADDRRRRCDWRDCRAGRRPARSQARPTSHTSWVLRGHEGHARRRHRLRGHSRHRPAMSLLKPGAEMLLLAAGLGFTIVQDRRPGRSRQQPTGHHLPLPPSAAGTSSQPNATVTPAMTNPAITVRPRNPSASSGRTPSRTTVRPARTAYIEYRAPWNTLVKMAQKRALVGAAFNTVAGSGLFVPSDDDEDDRLRQPEHQRPPRRSRRDAGPPASYYDDLPEARGVGVEHSPRYDRDARPR